MVGQISGEKFSHTVASDKNRVKMHFCYSNGKCFQNSCFFVLLSFLLMRFFLKRWLEVYFVFNTLQLVFLTPKCFHNVSKCFHFFWGEIFSGQKRDFYYAVKLFGTFCNLELSRHNPFFIKKL